MIEVHVSVLIGLVIMALFGGAALALLYAGMKSNRLQDEGWRVVPPPEQEAPAPRRMVDLPPDAPRTRLRQVRVQNRQDLK